MNFREKLKNTVSKTVTTTDLKLENNSEKTLLKYFTLKKGANKFRVYPPHPSSTTGAFAEVKCVWFLPYFREKKNKQGEIIKSNGSPVMERAIKPIFNAYYHGAKGKQIDVVTEYIETLKNSLKSQELPKEEIKEMLLPIYGSYTKKVKGIKVAPVWSMYVNQIVDDEVVARGMLEVKKSVKDRINELSADAEAGEPMLNPFTDVDEARLLKITVNPDDISKYYSTDIDTSYDKRTKKVKMFPLTDEDLDWFEKQTALSEKFRGSYSRSDFEFAAKSLQLIDEENDYGVFNSGEFQRILEDISVLFPVEQETERAKISRKTANSNPELQQEEPVEKKERESFDLTHFNGVDELESYLEDLSKSEIIQCGEDIGLKFNISSRRGKMIDAILDKFEEFFQEEEEGSSKESQSPFEEQEPTGMEELIKEETSESENSEKLKERLSKFKSKLS